MKMMIGYSLVKSTFRMHVTLANQLGKCSGLSRILMSQLRLEVAAIEIVEHFGGSGE
jgi:hypothetical protein